MNAIHRHNGPSMYARTLRAAAPVAVDEDVAAYADVIGRYNGRVRTGTLSLNEHTDFVDAAYAETRGDRCWKTNRKTRRQFKAA